MNTFSSICDAEIPPHATSVVHRKVSISGLDVNTNIPV